MTHVSNKLLVKFHQIIKLGAVWDKDDLVRIWGQRSKITCSKMCLSYDCILLDSLLSETI